MEQNVGLGLILCLVSVIFFECSGMFFQWVMCSSIFLCGFVVECIQGFPQFEPLAMLGGALWCTGNVFAFFIVKCIGLSLGILCGDSANLITGWCVGQLGIVIHRQNDVMYPVMNYIGFAIALISMAVFVGVQSDSGTSDSKTDINNAAPTDVSASAVATNPQNSVRRSANSNLGASNNKTNEPTTSFSGVDQVLATNSTPLLTKIHVNIESEGSLNQSSTQTSGDWLEDLHPVRKHLLGVSLSILSGVFYGSNFVPVTYLEEHGHSQDPLDYVFSHYVGIFLASSIYFGIYLLVCRHRSQNPQLAWKYIPHIICSGVMWAIAQTCWFVSNKLLQFIVTYPIIASGPGLVASLWGVFLFHEVRGFKNLTFLVIGCLGKIAAGLLTAASKAGF